MAIKVNGTAHDSGDAATWQAGSNTVVITATNSTGTRTYTVTVTKET